MQSAKSCKVQNYAYCTIMQSKKLCKVQNYPQCKVKQHAKLCKVQNYVHCKIRKVQNYVSALSKTSSLKTSDFISASEEGQYPLSGPILCLGGFVSYLQQQLFECDASISRPKGEMLFFPSLKKESFCVDPHVRRIKCISAFFLPSSW